MSAGRSSAKKSSTATVPAVPVIGGLPQNHPLRKACWIWPFESIYQHNTFAQFRRDFQLKSVPRRAPLFISADQSYVLYVNGRYVGRGPARGFQESWAFDEYDLAGFLQSGTNWISIQGYNGGISTFQYLFQAIAGMICAARWGKVEILSDRSWSSRVSPAHRPDTHRLNIQMGLQEHVDARLDDQSWIRSPRPPRGWPQRSKSYAFGSPPWHNMEPRGLPNLTSDLVPYKTVCGGAVGKCADGYAQADNIATPLRAEMKWLSWSPAAGRRMGDELEIDLPSAGGRGRLSAVTLDMGTIAIGAVQLDVRGAAGGEILDLHYGELVEPDGGPFVPQVSSGNPVGINIASRLVLKTGRTQHQFHHPMGHRYLALVARDSTRPLRIRVALRETRYPLEVKGSFTCSEPLLNDIHRVSCRTQQVCMLDAYVDTPWREQAQWWGDAQVQALNTFHLADDPRLLERGIRIIGRQQLPNGLTFAHAPTNCHSCVIPGFSLTWAMTFHDHYWQTGRTDLFTEHLDKLDRLVGYFEGEGRSRNGLLRYDERYWHYVDWAEVNTPQTIAPINLWYIRTLDRLIDLARAAGENNRLKQWSAIRKTLAEKVTHAFWDNRKGLWRDGLEGKAAGRYSIHSQMMAVGNNLLPERHEEIIRRAVLPYLHGHKIEGGTPSSFWITHVYAPLIRMGYAEEVIRHIRHAYGPMIPYGGTWETFDFLPGGYSVSHAWAAHAIQHLPAALGGICQTAPRWQKIDFEPLLTMSEVDAAQTRIPTPLGIIESSWRRQQQKGNASRVTVELKLPPKVTANVRLPGQPAQNVTGGRNIWGIELEV